MEAFHWGKEPKTLESCKFDHDLGTDRGVGVLRGPLASRTIGFVYNGMVGNDVYMSPYPFSRV